MTAKGKLLVTFQTSITDPVKDLTRNFAKANPRARFYEFHCFTERKAKINYSFNFDRKISCPFKIRS